MPVARLLKQCGQSVEMIKYAVPAPTIPIPFQKLLKIVALVDGQDPLTKDLLDHIAAARFEVEVSDRLGSSCARFAAQGSGCRSGRLPILIVSRIWPSWVSRAKSKATSTLASRRRRSTPNRSSAASSSTG